MKRAQADLKQTQEAIYQTALPLYKKYFPKASDSALKDRKKSSAMSWQNWRRIIPTITPWWNTSQMVFEATDFVKHTILISVPTTPLDVIAMPEFKRGEAIAYCDSPGPLEKNGKTFYAVAPMPNVLVDGTKRLFLPGE